MTTLILHWETERTDVAMIVRISFCRRRRRLDSFEAHFLWELRLVYDGDPVGGEVGSRVGGPVGGDVGGVVGVPVGGEVG